MNETDAAFAIQMRKGDEAFDMGDAREEKKRKEEVRGKGIEFGEKTLS